MRSLTQNEPVPADRGAGSEKTPSRPKRKLRREMFATILNRSVERPGGDHEDPLHESWLKLLAKYRRR